MISVIWWRGSENQKWVGDILVVKNLLHSESVHF